jgi:hypothetical protein
MIWRAVAAAAMTMTSLVLFSPAPPAHACLCVMGQPAKHARTADAVFTGRVIDTGSGRGAVVYDVTVDRVWKGDVADRVQVTSGAQSSACGLPDLPVGVPILWFASGEQPHLGAGLCSGTGASSAENVRAVTQVLGQPGEPVAPPEDELSSPDESRYDDLFVALGVGGGVLAGAGILYVVVRRRRAAR